MDIPDTELRERLISLGYNPPPITATSRNILMKKLKSLETGSEMESIITSSKGNEPEDEDIVSPVVTEIKNVEMRQRRQVPNFFPENIGLYSRCYVKRTDFWEKIGTFGTFFILLAVTIVVFLFFKFIGDWSDKRYRNINLNDRIYPKCSQGGQLGINCIPDSEFKFTESNLNFIRAALHHATLTDRCVESSKNNEFVGFYPIIKDDFIINYLVKELQLKETESKSLLRNAKVIFKMNPELDVKVLNDGLMYRNLRLLRSCGYASKNTIIYIYSLYFISSFSIVWFMYKLIRWVYKSRSDNDEERRRLIKDISDILKQNEKICGLPFVSTREMHKWLSSAIKLRSRLWNDVINYLKEHEENISLETKIIKGEECDVFYLKK